MLNISVKIEDLVLDIGDDRPELKEVSKQELADYGITENIIIDISKYDDSFTINDMNDRKRIEDIVCNVLADIISDMSGFFVESVAFTIN
jgi:hypothetical protein